MGLSFDDEASWNEAADSLRFAMPELRSIDKENDFSTVENDDSNIQISDRRSASETIDKYIELNDTGSSIEKDGDPVESV